MIAFLPMDELINEMNHMDVFLADKKIRIGIDRGAHEPYLYILEQKEKTSFDKR